MSDSALLPLRLVAEANDTEFGRDMADMFGGRRAGHAIRHFFFGKSLALWEAFTRAAREYYVFDSEAALAAETAPEIAARAREGLKGKLIVVELGTGSAKAVRAKTIPLLKALRPDVYVPVDWSAESAHVAAHLASEALPGLDVRPRIIDFNRDEFNLPANDRTVLVQLGSTLSNIEGFAGDPLPCQALEGQLRHYRRQLKEGDIAVFGLDQNQDRASLEAAYAHPLHVAFSESVLHRMKEELPISASFDPAAFAYRPVWIEESHQLVHPFIARADGSFRLGGETIRYKAGDLFVYDNSWKFPQHVLDDVFSRTGYASARSPVRDADKRIALQIMKVE